MKYEENTSKSEDLSDLLTSFLTKPLESVLLEGFSGENTEETDENLEENLENETFSYLDSFSKPQVSTNSLVKPEETTENEKNSSDFSGTLVPTERDILELTLKGRTPEIISVQLGLPKSYVRGFLLQKNVKEYLRELKEAKSQLLQLRALDIYGEIIDARVSRVDEEGGDYATLSSKDTVDILRAAMELSSSIDKSRQGDAEGDIYVNILQQVTKH